MSWNINRVVLIGRLANDPELKYTPSGVAVAKFSLAIGGKPKNDGSDSVSFINMTVWGKGAENLTRYQKKGDQIAVDGRLEQKSWTNQEGQKRSSIEVKVERIEYLNRKRGELPNVDFVGPDEEDPNF